MVLSTWYLVKYTPGNLNDNLFSIMDPPRLSIWRHFKQLPWITGEQLVIVGMLNSLVHVAMYSYYFLAALGPQFRKYLWWKVYVTRLQMVSWMMKVGEEINVWEMNDHASNLQVQFVIYILYMGGLILLRCDLPVSLSYYIIFQGGVFLALFANFYMKTYSKLSPSQPRKPVSQHSIMDGSSKLKVTWNFWRSAHRASSIHLS